MKKILVLVVAVLQTVFLAAQPQKDTLRILGVGNSWTRDSMRWLSAIARSAGRPVIVGHAYLGGSSLENQYRGIDDLTYTYRHGKQDQVVHATYQYWKYACSENPAKTPSSNVYKNGLNGCGVTLESVVTDEPWDIMVFQPSGPISGEARFRKAMSDSRDGYSLKNLELRIKQMMRPEVAERIRVWVMIPFTYAPGNADHRKHIRDEFPDGIDYDTQAGWDEAYLLHDAALQEKVPQLAAHIGAAGTVNVGRAISAARADGELNKSGFCLQRSERNTHLSEGLAMYVASLAYAYTLLDIKPSDISFYPEKSADSHLTGDRGETVKAEFVLTAELAAKARRLVWDALYE